MTVTPRRHCLFQTCRELHDFLAIYQQLAITKGHPQIVSISLPINSVDPLIIVQKFARSDQRYCYFEKRELSRHIQLSETSQTDRIAIAAIGAAAQTTLEGRGRFKAAQAFIQATLANTVICGDAHLPFAGPHFFGSFTFFDDATDGDRTFPAATVFLPEWQIVEHDQRCLLVANLVIQSSTDLTTTVDQFWQTRQAIQAIRYELPLPPITCREWLTRHPVGPVNHFQQAVQSALAAIQQHQLSKIVLAHAVDVTAPLPFDRVGSLHRLRQLYPGCYIFAVGNGEGQQFIGASPERLVSLQHGQLAIDALAGSAPRGRTAADDAQFANRLLHSVKEIHEHQVVAEFIMSQLQHLGLQPKLAPRRLLQLSNIQHLQTPITAPMQSDLHLLDVVAALHPTPAVAGMPRAIACEQIRRYEPFARSLYAAPIGWVDHQGNGEFAVGIRSALLAGGYARLYAGAGIVAGSNPDREFAEVQLKLEALFATLV